jgi:hypothetical protein
MRGSASHTHSGLNEFASTFRYLSLISDRKTVLHCERAKLRRGDRLYTLNSTTSNHQILRAGTMMVEGGLRREGLPHSESDSNLTELLFMSIGPLLRKDRFFLVFSCLPPDHTHSAAGDPCCNTYYAASALRRRKCRLTMRTYRDGPQGARRVT